MIEISDACKSIKGVRVLDCVSMVVPTGEVVGLAGVNGSGKTMLMRAVAGLIRLDAGFVAIDGKRVHRDIEFPSSIGLLIENPAFLDARTGFENLRILASLSANGARVSSRRGMGRDKAKVREAQPSQDARQLAVEALDLVGLDPNDKRKFRKYSLGMKQRLGLAAAIMGWPEVVLLDEPTNALDRAGVALFDDIMGLLRAHGSTVLLASHDAAVLARHVDEVYVVEDGRVLREKAVRCE